MHLHSYLVEYRDNQNNRIDLIIDKEIFQQDLSDVGVFTTVTGNDLGHPFVRLTNDEKQCRLAGLRLRDILRLSLRNYDMHCLKSEEQVEDANTHINQIV